MRNIICAGLCGLSFLTTPLFSAQTLSQQIGTANDAQNALTAYGQLRELNGTVKYVFEGLLGPSNSVLSGNLLAGIKQVITNVNSGNEYLSDTLFGQQIQLQNGLSTLIDPALESINTAIGNALGFFPSSTSGNLVSQLQQIENAISSMPSKGTTINDTLEHLGYFDITSFHSLTNWSFVTAPWDERDNTIDSVTNPQSTNTWQITMSGGSNNTYTTADLTTLYPGSSNGTVTIQTGDNIIFYGPGNASNIGLIFQYTGTGINNSSVSTALSSFDPSSIVLTAPTHLNLKNTISTLSKAIGYVELRGALTYWTLVTAPWDEIGSIIDNIQVNNNQWRITLDNSNTYDTGDLTSLYPPSSQSDDMSIAPGANILFSPTLGSGDNFVFQYIGTQTITSLANPSSIFILGDPITDPVRLVQPSLTSSIIRVSQLLKMTNPVYSGRNLSQTIGMIKAQVM